MKLPLLRGSLILFGTLSLILCPSDSQAQTTSTEQRPAPLTGEELFRRMSPSVFVIEALDENGSPVALGSGVALEAASKSGSASPPSFQQFLDSRKWLFIVTNAHVVSRGVSVRVRQGEKSWPAQIKEINPYTDLCLLRVEDMFAPTVSMRSSETLVVGERVYAIGSPQGLELSLSEGLISGFRKLRDRRVIQTTAAISHGSSGGGLFDTEGRLVGITSFFLGDAQNLNFAIPAEAVEALESQSMSETAAGWVYIGDEAMKERPEGPPLGFPPMGIGPAQQEWTERARRQAPILRAFWRRAVHAYRTALQLDPNNSEVWVKLGDAYSHLDDPRNMVDCFQRAIRLKPNDVSIWTRFAQAYETLGDNPGEVQACQNALQLRSRDAALWVNLANAYRRAQPNAALNALSKAEHSDPSDGLTWWRIGSGYQSLHHHKEAETAYIKSVRLEPGNPVYLFSLGQLYVAEHRRSKVRAVYEQLKTLDPEVAEHFQAYWSSY